MKYAVIAPVGDNTDALFVGMRDFPTEQVYLLTPQEYKKHARQVEKDLARFHIPVKIVDLKGNIWEALFSKVSELSRVLQGKAILVNTSTGDRITQCAATSAAFVNGLKAVSIAGDQAMVLPILKFSYYSLLSDRKMKILEVIGQDKTCCKSLEELAKKTKMSLPLISYHVNGNLKSDGLKDLGLVETIERGGRIGISLTTLGHMLMKGYIPQASS